MERQAGGGGVEAALQRGNVDRPAQRVAFADVEGGVQRSDAMEEPEPLLGEGHRHWPAVARLPFDARTRGAHSDPAGQPLGEQATLLEGRGVDLVIEAAPEKIDLKLALLADVLTAYGPTETLFDVEGARRLAGPCIHALGCPESQPQFVMGIDQNNRDVFSRVLFGARVSLQVGIVTVGMAILAGTLIGSIAGWARNG